MRAKGSDYTGRIAVEARSILSAAGTFDFRPRFESHLATGRGKYPTRAKAEVGGHFPQNLNAGWPGDTLPVPQPYFDIEFG